ncbi:TPA: polysaccharide biosynthesis tyrosine autokinase [Klebsiella pneumoniae]|uniref:Tyrosine-protein kinase n=2 Tax=Klebsiella TaxID=570 RepID=A0A0P0YR07_9ENTR|nr:polysaccharide biosynthesis tyrosine autokinase [Klebsiella pneumoniae]BAT23613.1 tyrosine-protein kinase [Klebsiella sp. 6168]MCD5718982.1 polysaccharide biosynthesis tyrosine autokinase [Klebsiella pneumoniae]MCP5600761.1 polysaccharide biosynthesis tyrosine autokinase [Klebsiella pneumoniae]STV92900.1 capsular exopolysaccharide family [Klebsiella pneumoniae]HBR2685317.1 polysaccharide biosynthesis tyrosine autokinase [Klebsiella pneumoniae]
MSPVMQTKAKNAESDDVDLARLVGEIIDHRKLIISVTAIFTFIALLYVLFATPIYQADSLVQIEQKQGNSLINSLNQALTDSQPQSAPELALLQSRMILGKTVDDLNLQIIAKQDYFPIIGRGWARLTGQENNSVLISQFDAPSTLDSEAEVTMTVISANEYVIDHDGNIVKGKVGVLLKNNDLTFMVTKIDAEPNSKFIVTKKTKLEAINNLQKFFSVADQGKDTGILNLTIQGDNPALLRKILDSISQNYLAQNIDRQAAQDAKSLDFLNEQLPKIRKDLDTAEDKLNYYRQQKDSVDLSLEAKAILDQIVNVDNQLNELTFREAEISQLFTKEHPTYKSLIEKRTILEKEKERLNKKVSAMPATQQEVLRLSRDVDSGRAVYMQLLNRQQELNIAKSSAIGNVRIIDNAVTEPVPVKPKKFIVILIGLVLGIVFSVSVVIIKTFFNKGIESPEQLEELGVNVYASIPVSEWLLSNKGRTKGLSHKGKFKKQEHSFLAIENPADLAIEAIRGLRTSLHFAMMEAKNNVLMISGATPDAGKTFISSNLSAIIAQTGKKILFIDADMRKGYVHKLLLTGQDNCKGLSEVLSSNENFEKVVHNINFANFDFIARGQIPPNPAELLMHKRFEELMTWAMENYDLIIIDTPPILAVTDAAVIGRYAGTSLLVARFEENTPKEIYFAVKRFEQNGVTVKGCILNGVVKKASSYYGYGYNSYGYTYKDDK